MARAGRGSSGTISTLWFPGLPGRSSHLRVVSENACEGGQVSRAGNFARGHRSLRRASWVVFSALNLGLLGGCAGLQNQIANGDSYPHGPDVLDRIRNIDLLPRKPQPTPATDQAGGVSAKSQVYPGATISAVEAAPARAQSGPSGGGGGGGDGYELNFENTPIASVAKVVLGDILGTGYTIDPRVMGMISLSSGRPVPKSDLLFVLENALRLSGVVLVKDVQG